MFEHEPKEYFGETLSDSETLITKQEFFHCHIKYWICCINYTCEDFIKKQLYMLNTLNMLYWNKLKTSIVSYKKEKN
jgi:hypothetical protein